MLRVGLTGGLGSGKSTVAAMLQSHGAHLLQADEIAREMMQPGEPVYAAIVAHFGSGVVLADGQLDRRQLAQLAFARGRVDELNQIVHPQVIARQAQLTSEIGAREPAAVVVVESALILETPHGGEGAGSWSRRFDRLIVVVSADEQKIARFVNRSLGGRPGTDVELRELAADARQRLQRQITDTVKARSADFLLTNNGSLADLQTQVDALWPSLAAEARSGGHAPIP